MTSDGFRCNAVRSAVTIPIPQGMWYNVHMKKITFSVLACVCAASAAWAAGFVHIGKAQLAGLGSEPVPFGVSVAMLASGRGEEERYASPKDEDKVTLAVRDGRRDAGAWDICATVRNGGDAARCMLLTVEAKVPFAEFSWWNGYMNQIPNAYELGEGMCVFFPAQAALGREKALALGMDPMMLAAGLRSTCKRDRGDRRLRLAFPVHLDPGESFEARTALAACRARYRWHDVVERWYELFPKAFAPAEGIHPAAASAGASYLFWKPNKAEVRSDADRAALLRRFFGSHGAWDWCYKPFVRGGDWAITDEWSAGWNRMTPEKLEVLRQRTRDRLAPAAALNVAPMWYLNVCWTEEQLWRTKFPGILRGDKPTIGKCWSQSTVRPIYCSGDTPYARLFKSGLEKIPLSFPAAKGVGWDSCFANSRIPEDHEGFAGTRPHSYEKGIPFAHEGVGIAELLDFNHRQFSGPHRMANALNYKLVAPWMVAVRGDTGLYEGTPMTRPERLWRLESLRARFGPRKFITWHKGSAMAGLAWAELASLPDDEARNDAHRQIMDDNLLLSYYWGTVPAPLIPSENRERWTGALPELIDLNSRGWHPSPAVDVPRGVLAARYGDGADTRIAVMNIGFEERRVELSFPKEYWPEPLFGASMGVTLPPRDVVILAPGKAPAPAKIPPYVKARTVHRPTLLDWLDQSRLLDTWNEGE